MPDPLDGAKRIDSATPDPLEGATRVSLSPEDYPIPGTMSPSVGSALTTKLGNIIKRNAAPIAGQTAGQLAGEALGVALAPESGGLSVALPLVLGAAGAGAANMATNKLPPKYGGQPDESKTASFLWGAIPATVGGAATKGAGHYLEGKAAKASEEAAKKFAKETLEEAERQRGIIEEGIRGTPPTTAAVRNIGRRLGSPTGIAASPLEGEARTQATDAATNLVLGPINRMRQARGEPIGAAYAALKGNDQRISPEAAKDLADAAQAVRDDLIAPAPKANSIFARIKHFVPQAPTTPENAIIELPGGEVMERPALPGRAPTVRADFENMTPAQIDEISKIQASGRSVTQEELNRILGAKPGEAIPEPTVKPPTLDDLRELRQRVNESLRSAKGGDVHALLNLQSALDNELVEHLPEDIGEMRQSYRGFIKNYPWRDINKLRAARTPEQVGDWLFEQNPSVINEVVHNAKPVERDAYKQLFAQRVLTKVDPELPAAEQMAAIRKQLQPYIRSGSAKALYGDATERDLKAMIYSPARRAEAAKDLASPAGKARFTDAFGQAANKAGRADLEAAKAGFEAWLAALPPEQEATVLQYVQPIRRGTEVPVLPSPGQTLAAHIKGHPLKVYAPQFVTREAVGAGVMGLLGSQAHLGNFMAIAAVGFAAMAGGGAGYNAMMRAGGADLIGKMYERPAARYLGAAAFKALVILGGRVLHQQAQPPSNQ